MAATIHPIETDSTERQTTPTERNTSKESARENNENALEASFRTEKTQLSDDSTEAEERPTQWRGLLVTGLIMYLTTSMGQTLAVSGWPYLRSIDPDVPVSFLGYVQALTRCGHAIGACVFAVHAYTTKRFKRALIVGRVLSVIGCAFYIFIELFATDYRRWAYMLKFLLQSVAEGSLIVIRSYVPRMSRERDRQQAFSIIEGANMLAIVTGPLVQMGCSYIDDHETPLPWLKFTAFTVPIWISLFLNLVTLVISVFFFTEPNLEEIDDEHELPLGQAMRKAWRQIRKLDGWLVGLCFVEKTVASYGFAAMYTTMSPYVTETFNISNERALWILSVGQAGAGLASILTVALFVFTPLSRNVRASVLFPLGLGCYFSMYLLSWPWPGISEHVPLRNHAVNATDNVYGCDYLRYGWCGEDGMQITDRRLWLVSTALLFGAGIPITLIAFDTIYSKVLGGIDQNIMQGLLVIVDDLALAGAPVISTTSFEEWGPGPMWLSVAGLCLAGLLTWIAFLPKMRRVGI